MDGNNGTAACRICKEHYLGEGSVEWLGVGEAECCWSTRTVCGHLTGVSQEAIRPDWGLMAQVIVI